METIKPMARNGEKPVSELTKRELISTILYAGLLSNGYSNSDVAVREASLLLKSLFKDVEARNKNNKTT